MWNFKARERKLDRNEAVQMFMALNNLKLFGTDFMRVDGTILDQSRVNIAYLLWAKDKRDLKVKKSAMRTDSLRLEVKRLSR